MDLAIVIDDGKARAMLANIKGGVPKALSGAINDTLKSAKTELSKRIRDKVNIKKKDIDRHITIVKARPNKLDGKLHLSESARLGLKYFGASQSKKKGVSYKIEKGGTRKKITDAFGPKIPRLGGQVFRRVGKKRLPITKLEGPSPGGVAVKAGLDKAQQKSSQAEFNKKLDQRIRFLLLKHSGKI